MSKQDIELRQSEKRLQRHSINSNNTSSSEEPQIPILTKLWVIRILTVSSNEPWIIILRHILVKFIGAIGCLQWSATSSIVLTAPNLLTSLLIQLSASIFIFGCLLLILNITFRSKLRQQDLIIGALRIGMIINFCKIILSMCIF